MENILLNKNDVGEKSVICIMCPIGCRLTVIKDRSKENGYRVEGNTCKRGIDYGIKEVTNPTRILPTTVKIKNASLRRLPVRTEHPIPKKLIFECMKEINKVKVVAPIKSGDIIIKNIAGTGINVIASRSMSVKS